MIYVKVSTKKYINLSSLKNQIDFVLLKPCLYLKILLKKKDSPSNIEVKKLLRKSFNQKFKKDFNLVKNIFLKDTINFGNRMISLSNAIYYSEILGIKNIYLNSKYNWYINNDVITNKIKISVASEKSINCHSIYTFCGKIYDAFYYPFILKPEKRFNILKEEIKRNLPHIKINKNDLYIYIRSGDSFQPNGNLYTPAPYCFYKRIMEIKKYKNIYIISQDDLNPIIGKLLSDYPKIIHYNNSIEIDISILSNAYNLVNQLSSFIQVCISLNDNLINLYEYEAYKLNQKIFHMHHDITQHNKLFNLYKMKPSKDYYINMFFWKNTEEQRKLLFSENCKHDFRKVLYHKPSFP